MSKGCSKAPGDSCHVMKWGNHELPFNKRKVKFYFQLSYYSLLTSTNYDFPPWLAATYIIVLHEIFQIKKFFSIHFLKKEIDFAFLSI